MWKLVGISERKRYYWKKVVNGEPRYQATLENNPPVGDGGWIDLDSLLRAKGDSLNEQE